MEAENGWGSWRVVGRKGAWGIEVGEADGRHNWQPQARLQTSNIQDQRPVSRVIPVNLIRPITDLKRQGLL